MQIPVLKNNEIVKVVEDNRISLWLAVSAESFNEKLFNEFFNELEALPSHNVKYNEDCLQEVRIGSKSWRVINMIPGKRHHLNVIPLNKYTNTEVVDNDAMLDGIHSFEQVYWYIAELN